MKIVKGVCHKRFLFHVFSYNFDRAEKYRSLYKVLVAKEIVGLH